MFYWIYAYPSLYIGALFAVVSVAVTGLSILVVRRFFHPWIHTDERANDMVGFALSSFAVLYGLLVGLLAVAAYQNFSSVSDIVTKEASSVGALFRDLRSYPQPRKGRLRDELRDYTRNVIDKSWPEQQRGIVPKEESHLMAKFIDDLLSFEPSNKSEEILHGEALHRLNSVIELQRSRLANVTTGIPTVFWWVVVIGAVIFVVLLAMLGMEIHVHLILGAAVSLFLGLVIFLIAAMDNPFRGEVSVGPDAFEAIYASLMKPNDAVSKSMAILIAKAAKYGAPRLEGRDPVDGKDVPGLYFGATKMNKFFDVVDEVVKENGGTATVFVKAGNEYVRVTTNVKKDDGSRAIGTILDPNGPAIAMIRKGEAFYGEAIILGKPYLTGYEPIRDASNNVIGIYYVGYSLQ
jgi:ABC-type multidrug transport system fused ATPase/permease subunit